MERLKRYALYGGPSVAVGIGLTLSFAGLSAPACWTASVTALCAIWWVFEPIPMPATGLIPFAVFPLTGVLTHSEVARSYGHSLVLLMLAGAIISMAMEKSQAHRRVALGMVRLVGGTRPRRLVLGFLLASAVLSMWISNTATVVMLLPVALAVVTYHGEDEEKLAVPLLLAVAYGASIGGSATPVGTPPNVIFMSQYLEATGREISFAAWMALGLPVVIVMLPVAWLWLVRHLGEMRPGVLPTLGPWRNDERRVLIVFACTALAWTTRTAPFGGWQELIGAAATAGDSTVGLAAVVVMFLVPSGMPAGGRLLDWASASKIPWGVFIMIGGGMALGQAFGTSGLGEVLGEHLAPITHMPRWAMTASVSFFATFLTEITSNTAVANMLMPVLAAAALSSGIEPAHLMVPATLGLNWAFMLPVAGAANALVYGTGRISTAQMAREGLALNLIGVVIITLVGMWSLG